MISSPNGNIFHIRCYGETDSDLMRAGWAFVPVAGLSDKNVQPTFFGPTNH